jgi:hypothetical protein
LTLKLARMGKSARRDVKRVATQFEPGGGFDRQNPDAHFFDALFATRRSFALLDWWRLLIATTSLRSIFAGPLICASRLEWRGPSARQ